MFTKTKIYELSSIASSSLSFNDELVLYNNTTQTTGKLSLNDLYNKYSENYLGTITYQDGATYQAGDLVVYNNRIYRCLENTMASDIPGIDPNVWEETSISMRLQELQNYMNYQDNQLSSRISNLNNGYGSTYPNGISLASSASSWTNIATHTFSVGTYLVEYGLSFAKATAGLRGMWFGPSASQPDTRTMTIIHPCQTEMTNINATRIMVVQTQAAYAVKGQQTSGSTLTCTPYMHWIKLR